MGQSMKKLARGKDDEQKKKEIIEKVKSIMHENIKANIKAKGDKMISKGEFYHEIFTAVQKMNESAEFGFQVNCPTKEELEQAFKKHHSDEKRELTKEEFEKIMKDLAEKFMKDFASKMGAKGIRDILLYIYGFPISATLIKQAVFPEIVSDDVFIPLVTAASVFVFAKTKTL